MTDLILADTAGALITVRCRDNGGVHVEHNDRVISLDRYEATSLARFILGEAAIQRHPAVSPAKARLA